MDFKVAGTREGITALQMDIKIHGLTRQLMSEALEQAHVARMFILDKMVEVLGEPRTALSPYAPRLHRMTINPDKIRDIIGPGGKMIRRITEETKTTIDIEDDGTVIIGSTDADGLNRAIEIITGLTREVEVGAIYTGKVTRIMAFGAFVEILPGKEGLVHISELADYRVPRVEDVVSVGDEVKVVVTEIDRQGRINLSRRALLPPREPDEAGDEELDELGDEGIEDEEEEGQPTDVAARPREPREFGGRRGGTGPRPPRREGFGGNGGGYGGGGFGRAPRRSGEAPPRREGPGGPGRGFGGPGAPGGPRRGPGGPGAGPGDGRGPRGPRREGPGGPGTGGGGPRRPPREPFSPRW
jgi:predicted RNA-binding protein with RPS1 domain